MRVDVLGNKLEPDCLRSTELHNIIYSISSMFSHSSSLLIRLYFIYGTVVDRSFHVSTVLG